MIDDDKLANLTDAAVDRLRGGWRRQLLVITGPTCIGKSDLAADIACAAASSLRSRALIINADSKQVYREIGILSNQPEGRRNIPHELFGHRSVVDFYSVGQWLHDIEALPDLHSEKNIFIVVGGTGMYINALLRGISDIPSDPDIKMKLGQLSTEHIRDQLFARDPWAHQNIAANDRHRLMRACEVLLTSGRSISVFRGNRHPSRFMDAFTGHDCRIHKLALLPNGNEERNLLYDRANKRFLRMIAMGAIAEADAARKIITQQRLPSFKVLGLPELIDHIDGRLDLDSAIGVAQCNTRRYIKRQLTWIRHQHNDFEFISPYAL